MLEKTYKKKHLTSFQLIILGFAGVILLGTVLLMLPFSTLDKVPTSFHEALFTATSAVCVTDFRSMCDRPCCEGYWKLLVCGRTDDYSCTHTNWRAWCGNGGSICFPFFWKKDITYAKEHHAGCDIST
ncbi:trk-type K+ transport systems membrane components [Clostridium sp. CAG:75]|nr:trk-type K+ transport systems membrane components [Clostridium sp. CAG:75]